jgi:Flp pilus assembly protein TadG
MVEFAFIGAMLIPLTIETLQAGFYFYASASLDRAMAAATRQIRTGSIGAQALSADQFRNKVLCPLLSPGMSCSNVVTNVQTLPEALYPSGFYAFVNAGQTALITPQMDNTKTSFCTGTTGSYIFAQAFYAMPVFSPVWLSLFATNWKGWKVRFVSSSAAFKNEPFPGSSAGAC